MKQRTCLFSAQEGAIKTIFSGCWISSRCLRKGHGELVARESAGCPGARVVLTLSCPCCWAGPKRREKMRFFWDTGLREKRKGSLDWGNTSWFLCLQCLREQNSYHCFIKTSSKTYFTNRINSCSWKDNPLEQKCSVSWDMKQWNWL